MKQILTDIELEHLSKKIAINARKRLGDANIVWIYSPAFQNAVAAEAFAMLRAVVIHERAVE